MLYTVRNPIGISSYGLASFAFARHYSQNLGWFLFLVLLRCFSSDRSPHIPILFSIWCMDFTPCGLLHSDICASTLAYSYTQLFAVNHVLLRLLMPRHSPCALISFTICFFTFMSSLKLLWFLASWYLKLLSFSSFRISALLSCFIQFSSCLLYPLLKRIYFNKYFLNIKQCCLFICFVFIQIHSFFISFGGHKWTRTTDLTLIRRAL